MKKFLYLTHQRFVETWISGGRIPVSLASTYLSASREGILTPDENTFHRSNVDLTKLDPILHMEPGSKIVGLTMTGGTFNGNPIPDIIEASYGEEDGLVICLSNHLDREIALKLGKEACVEIADVSVLKACIDEQLGTDGLMGVCEYTDGHERDTFLKSTADEWQSEFRLYWPIVLNDVWVTIPSGLAMEMPFDEPLPRANPSPARVNPIAYEFTANDLESIKSLMIGYLRRARHRPVSRPELCSVVLGKLRFNSDRSARVLALITQAGLVRIIPCPIHHGHVELTSAGVEWTPRIVVDLPDPKEKPSSWTSPLESSIANLCPNHRFGSSVSP